MRQISDQVELDSIVGKVRQLIPTEEPLFAFPRHRFKYIYHLEPAFLINPKFYAFLRQLCALHQSEQFYIAMLEPSPTEYFRHFRKYPVFEFRTDATAEMYLAMLHADPGDSPADAIAYVGEQVAMFPPDISWLVVSDEPAELAIVAAREEIPVDTPFPPFLTDEQYRKHVNAIVNYLKLQSSKPI